MKNLARAIYVAGCLLLALCGLCAAQKLAITMDDLPLNGLLPPGVTRAETTKNVLAILKKRHVPPVYGFINARKLEGNADGAEALKLWAAAEPVGNHTYAHMDLEPNTVEAFEREIEENEPALSCWHGRVGGEMNGTGFAIRICVRETRWRNGARYGRTCKPAGTGSRR